MGQGKNGHLDAPSQAALRLAYLTALAILAALSLVEYATMDHLVRTQHDRARLIEQSARQRYLVQRIALLSQQLLSEREPGRRERLRAGLAEAGRQVRRSHDDIVHAGGPYDELAALTPEMREIYTQDPLRLEERIHAYLASVDSLASVPDQAFTEDNRHYGIVMIAASGETSALLDQVVARLVQSSEVSIQRIRNTAGLTLGATFIALVLVGALIFEPLVYRILRTRRMLEQVNRGLTRLSERDPLTGVANRRSFEARLDEEWRRASRDSSSLALLMIDLDHFKAYNDRYGHQAGDDCLQVITRDIKARLRRPGDFLARFGGEEFVVLLPDTDLSGAVTVAEDLRRRTVALSLEHNASPVAGVVTLSIGAAAAEPGEEYSRRRDLVAAADHALYEAKRGGRNQIRIAQNRASEERDVDRRSEDLSDLAPPAGALEAEDAD
jgi:diguanylate cyclase (GGDEF)-like protein